MLYTYTLYAAPMGFSSVGDTPPMWEYIGVLAGLDLSKEEEKK